MDIKKFSHVANGKTIYAVTGEINAMIAFNEVYKYKKMSKDEFYKTHKVYTGLIKNNKLYIIDINVADDFGKNYIPCYVIARDTIDIDSYKQVA